MVRAVTHHRLVAALVLVVAGVLLVASTGIAQQDPPRKVKFAGGLEYKRDIGGPICAALFNVRFKVGRHPKLGPFGRLTFREAQQNRLIRSDTLLVYLDESKGYQEVTFFVAAEDPDTIIGYAIYGPDGQLPIDKKTIKLVRSLEESAIAELIRSDFSRRTARRLTQALDAGPDACAYRIKVKMPREVARAARLAVGLDAAPMIAEDSPVPSAADFLPDALESRDLSGDGIVDITDLGILFADLLATPGSRAPGEPADTDRDGILGPRDVYVLAGFLDLRSAAAIPVVPGEAAPDVDGDGFVTISDLDLAFSRWADEPGVVPDDLPGADLDDDGVLSPLDLYSIAVFLDAGGWPAHWPAPTTADTPVGLDVRLLELEIASVRDADARGESAERPLIDAFDHHFDGRIDINDLRVLNADGRARAAAAAGQPPPPPPLRGDIDGDGGRDQVDIDLVSAELGPDAASIERPDPDPMDLDGDGIVSDADVTIIESLVQDDETARQALESRDLSGDGIVDMPPGSV